MKRSIPPQERFGQGISVCSILAIMNRRDVETLGSLPIRSYCRRRTDDPTLVAGRRLAARGDCVLRVQLGARRLRLTDDQRRRLAAKAKGLGKTDRGGHHRHARNLARLAPEVDSREVRWQCEVLRVESCLRFEGRRNNGGEHVKRADRRTEGWTSARKLRIAIQIDICDRHSPFSWKCPQLRRG